MAINVVGTLGGSALLELGVWPATEGALLVYTLSIPTLAFLIDPQKSYLPHAEDDGSDYPLLGLPLDSPDDVERVLDARASSNAHGAIPPVMDDDETFSDVCYSFAKHAWYYKLIMCIFCLYELGMGIMLILPQWISKRYEWSLAQTGLILSGAALLGALVISALPHLGGYFARRRSWSSHQTDLLVSRLSIFVAAFGALLVAASTHRILFVISLAVFNCGAGFLAALLSFLTPLLEEFNITKVFMLVSIIQASSNMLNGPLWAAILSSSFKIDLGLPFFCAAVIFLMTGILIHQLRPLPSGTQEDEDQHHSLRRE